VSLSYSILLRDKLYDATIALPYFAAFHSRKTRFFPIQKEDLPLVSVTKISGSHAPDGQGNAADIRFNHTVRIGFQVVIVNNDPEEAERELDRAHMAIMDGLWRDQYLTNMIDSYQPGTVPNIDNVRFESIPRGDDLISFGNAGQNNETPIAELRYEVSIFYRAEYGPTIEDDLEEVRITTGMPGPGATDAERAAIEQARQRILLDTTP
jgi:hypothetical protein